MISAFGVEHLAKGRVIPLRSPCAGGCDHLAEVGHAYRPGGKEWVPHAHAAMAAGHSDEEIFDVLHAASKRQHTERLTELGERAKAKQRGIRMELKRRERAR